MSSRKLSQLIWISPLKVLLVSGFDFSCRCPSPSGLFQFIWKRIAYNVCGCSTQRVQSQTALASLSLFVSCVRLTLTRIPFRLLLRAAVGSAPRYLSASLAAVACRTCFPKKSRPGVVRVYFIIKLNRNAEHTSMSDFEATAKKESSGSVQGHLLSQ